eukprot:653400-Prymnesium_polylepis.1
MFYVSTAHRTKKVSPICVSTRSVTCVNRPRGRGRVVWTGLFWESGRRAPRVYRSSRVSAPRACWWGRLCGFAFPEAEPADPPACSSLDVPYSSQ